jgi:hypothetical protein
MTAAMTTRTKKPPAKTAKTAKTAKATKTTATKKTAAKKPAAKRKYEAKTKETTASVDAFLAKVDPARRNDCRAIAALMQKATGEPPRMWGTSIVGFGSYHYRYDSGHEGDSCLVGFSPRAQNITLYFVPGLAQYQTELSKLGPHKTGKGCLYIKRLADVDARVLSSMIDDSVRRTRARV